MKKKLKTYSPSKSLIKQSQKSTVKKKLIVPTKISTDSSLFALTAAFALMDLISSNSGSTLNRIFQKNEKDEYVLVEEHYLDQTGDLEKKIWFYNGRQWLIYKTAKLNKKLENLKEKKRNAKFYSQSEKLLKELGFDFENSAKEFKPMFLNLIQDSLQRASEVLFWAMFLERYAKFDTAQGVVSFCYTLVNSLQFLSDYKTFRTDLLKLGKLWKWQVAWEIALSHEKVKKFWETKEKRGEAYLKEWKAGCQKLATNSWSKDRKQQIEKMEEGALILRERLKTKFNAP